MAYSFQTPIRNPQLIDGSQLPLGQYSLTHHQIPLAWFAGENLASLCWNGRKLNLPEDPNGTLLNMRGKDIPACSHQKTKRNKCPSQRDSGTLIVSHSGFSKVYSLPGSKVNEEGSFYWSIQLFSQVPTLTCDFKREIADGTLITRRVVFYGNTGMQSVEYHNPNSIMAGRLPFLPEYQQAAAQGRVAGVSIKFGDQSPVNRMSNCVKILCGYDGCGPDEQNRWKSESDMMDTLTSDVEEQQGFDEVIWKFLKMKNCTFTFLRSHEVTDHIRFSAFDIEYRHWIHVMRLAISSGPFWFYRTQTSRVVSDAETTEREKVEIANQLVDYSDVISLPPVPFWLIQTATVFVTQEGVTDLVPLERSSPVPDVRELQHRFWRWPSREIYRFARALGLVR